MACVRISGSLQAQSSASETCSGQYCPVRGIGEERSLDRLEAMWQSFFGKDERSYGLVQEHEGTICVNIFIWYLLRDILHSIFWFYWCLRSRDIECHLVSPEEIQDLCPLLHTDDLVGGLWIPNDGVGDPYQICLTLIEEARQKGIVLMNLKN